MQTVDGLNDTQVRELMDALVRFSDIIAHMDTDSNPAVTASESVEFDVLQSAVGVTFQQINVDFVDADVDVASTIMGYHVGGTTKHPHITWNDLPLNDGEFGSDTIHGMFYGPNHEEVGGVFRRDGLLGTFGGAREN